MLLTLKFSLAEVNILQQNCNMKFDFYNHNMQLQNFTPLLLALAATSKMCVHEPDNIWNVNNK